MITRKDVDLLSSGQILYCSRFHNADGTPYRYKITSIKLWKRTPEAFEIRLKRGIRTFETVRSVSDGDVLKRLFVKESDAIANACVPNIDALDQDDLLAICQLSRKDLKKEAEELFPSKPNDYVTTMFGIACYCQAKRWAIQCRMGGLIQTAIEIEIHCQEIYESLPDYAKW